MSHQLRLHTSFAEDPSLKLNISQLPMAQALGNTKPLTSTGTYTQTHISTQTQRHIHAHTLKLK